MIDIEKAKMFFLEYVKAYNAEDGKIALKINHILRVSKISREIAEKLNLEYEDKILAELIGLLHDIGRFEQIKRYNTFSDGKSIDHGNYGAKILFEDGLIRKFIEDDKYDEIIRKAILNHNKLIIEEGLNERELLHVKIIRDADKLDIFNVLIIEKLENSYGCIEMKNEKISHQIYLEFKKQHMINYNNIKTHADLLVAHIAYIFDLNFNYSLKYVKENNYIKRLEEKVDFQDKETLKYLYEINEIVYKYIEDTLKK